MNSLNWVLFFVLFSSTHALGPGKLTIDKNQKKARSYKNNFYGNKQKIEISNIFNNQSLWF